MHKLTHLPPQRATINSLSHDGRGIAHIQGKITFIEGALPGEDILFNYTNRRSKFDEGKMHESLTIAPERTSPECEHFATCGGCNLQHLQPHAQRTHKANILFEQLQHFGRLIPTTKLPVLTGPVWGYRRKARLGVKYITKKNKLLVGFREKNGHFLTDINMCPVLHPSVEQLIIPLKKCLLTLAAYQTITQIEIAIGDHQTALIFRHLGILDTDDLNKLAHFGEQHNLHVYLQSGGHKSIKLLWPPSATTYLSYTLPEQQLELDFHPADFTQVNADMNQQMVQYALELLAPQATDHVLDLFCGLGNFSLPLAKYAQQVIGVEGHPTMVARAVHNAQRNSLTNVNFYSANLASNCAHEPWAKQTYHKILLDPPRTGALDIIRHFPTFQAKRIVYISCNPATLARDAGELVHQQGYRLNAAGIMDMFPHTAHVEAVAVFEKN